MRPWRLEWILVVVWLGAAAGVMFGDSWLFEASFLLSLAAIPLLLVSGLLILIYLVFSKRWKSPLALFAGAVLVAVSPLPGLGHRAWSWSSFVQHRADYEAVVAEASRLPASGVHRGEAYRIERGPPLRIAFPRSHGMPDGWSGVVYDPSLTVDDLAGAAEYVFSSRVHSCIRITGPWQRCWFD